MRARVAIVTMFFGVGSAIAMHAAAQAVADKAVANAGTTITLNVVVNDKSGGVVGGLDAKDFTVLDGKKPLSITSVREVDGTSPSADPAVEAVILIDNIVSDFETLANLRRNLTENLRNVGGQMPLPTSLVFLTDQGLKTQGMATRDPKVLLANLESNPTAQQATQFSAGYDRWAEMRQKSLTALQVLAVDLQKRPGRKLLIWVGAGWPAFEAETTQKSAKERQDLFNFIVGMSALLRQADITLYSVDPAGNDDRRRGSRNYETQDYARGGNNQQMHDPMAGNNFKYKDFVKGVASAKQADNGDLMLQVFAAQTGGKVLFANNNIYQLIDQCFADAKSFYSVKFTAPAAAHKDEYHDLQVQVDKPGLKARTRTGYYAQPE